MAIHFMDDDYVQMRNEQSDSDSSDSSDSDSDWEITHKFNRWLSKK